RPRDRGNAVSGLPDALASRGESTGRRALPPARAPGARSGHRAWRHDRTHCASAALVAVGGDRRVVLSFRTKARRREEVTSDIPAAPGREVAHPVLRTGPALAMGRHDLRAFASLRETRKRTHAGGTKSDS